MRPSSLLAGAAATGRLGGEERAPPRGSASAGAVAADGLGGENRAPLRGCKAATDGRVNQDRAPSGSLTRAGAAATDGLGHGGEERWPGTRASPLLGGSRGSPATVGRSATVHW